MYLPIVSSLCLSIVSVHDIRITIDDSTRILVREVLGLHKNVATFSRGQRKKKVMFTHALHNRSAWLRVITDTILTLGHFSFEICVYHYIFEAMQQWYRHLHWSTFGCWQIQKPFSMKALTSLHTYGSYIRMCQCLTHLGMLRHGTLWR